MSLFKYMERVKYMDYLIRKSATGTALDFARKMNISRAVLMSHIAELREVGAPIVYCSERQSYQYSEKWCVSMYFNNEPPQSESIGYIKGGIRENFSYLFLESEYTRLATYSFASPEG